MPRFQLDFISLQSCGLGAQFPQWLQTQKELSFIDISRANISGEVPDWFWNFSAKVYHIDLSQNYFRGEVPEFTERVRLTKLDLSHNNFHGPLPHFSPNMMTLILARNSFNGTIAPVCESLVMNNSLSLLDLSSNSLSGQLLDCWRYGKNLQGLNLAHNDLSGEIPHSIGDLANLFFLQLQNNSFSKNLPSSLENVSGLKILDVSENSLSGKIPIWLGESLSTLEILKLSRNKFDGIIPREICQLKYLYFLDLSSNALSEVIPRCVGNLRTMSGEEEAPSFTYGPYADYRIPGMFVIKGNGYDIFFRWFFIVIDLSDNHLSGDIPEEITSLTALIGLNLSRNHFTGAIPRKVPHENQFETFDNSSYVGNPNLCGAPLSRVCSDNLHDDMIDCSSNNNNQLEVHEQGENNNWLEEFSFYISMGIGFNTGFLLFWVTLMLKTSWRYAYMRCLENMGNKIYVFAAIRLRKIQAAKTVSNCPN
ncbi:hypothetical protein MTR67_053131 [Solanum verrucosum]|uniref:Uncharacterized protein n=1 Tax=Solanum verrucosum TaxID=315347 RepID=A0AAF1A1N6_SOLVR|nr:hypothetical protein MTR67_053131 [Solanum verrucosum]